MAVDGQHSADPPDGFLESFCDRLPELQWLRWNDFLIQADQVRFITHGLKILNMGAWASLSAECQD